MRIVIVGAGHIGRTLVEALSYRYVVHTVEGNGASRGVLQVAGVSHAVHVFATTARDEANLVAAMLVKRLSGARTIVRASNVE